MKRRHLSWLLVCALGVALAGAEGAEDDWLARVRTQVGIMPSRARRVMLVFPLVEAGSEDGTIGWGRGLIALQAMWVSSFAPDRLLDTWDFTADWRFGDQQLFGAGRRVTPEKIEAVCAVLDAQNYVTGTLEVGPDRYVARLVLHGENGVQEIEHAGPKAELPKLPCLIARDVVAYLRVPITARQQDHLRRAPLSSVELFDEVADHFHAAYYFETYQPWYWESVAERCRTPWTQFAHAQAEFWAFTWKTWGIYNDAPPETQTTALDVLAASAFLVHPDDQYPILLRLLTEDPYNPEVLLHLAAELMQGSGEEELAWAVLDRIATLYGDSHLGSLYPGLFLAPYAWDVRRSVYAAEASGEPAAVGRKRDSRAFRDLEAALAKEPRCWTAAYALINDGDFFGPGEQYSRERFQQATAACPTHWQSYERMLDAIRTQEDCLEFGRQCAATGLYDTRIPAFLLDVHCMVADGPIWASDGTLRQRVAHTEYFSRPEVWQEVQPVLDRITRQNPLDYKDLSFYLTLAYWRGDTELASRLLAGLPKEAYDLIADEDRWTRTYAFHLPAGLHDEVTRWARAGFPPLAMAAMKGDADTVEQLIADGEEVNLTTHDDWTALHAAADCGSMAVVRILLQAGANANAAADDGTAPLHLAAKNGYLPAALMLLTNGADIDAEGPEGLSALILALEAYEEPVVHLLLKRGADPNVRNAEGLSALRIAAENSETDVVRALVGAGADVNTRVEGGGTVLYELCRRQEPESMALLLELGADPDLKSDDEFAPLYIAASHDYREIAKLLLDHGADLAARSKRGFTPVHIAASKGRIDMLKLLIAHGADVRDQGPNNGYAPLHSAVRTDHLDCAKLLLEAGADIHCRTNNLWQPIHQAAYRNQVEMVRFLLEKGAEDDSECMWGTPLHLAAMCGSKELVLLFLERGVDVNGVDRNGRTPTGQALKEGHPDIAELLREHGGVE